jgi:YjbE family integral membrane protein
MSRGVRSRIDGSKPWPLPARPLQREAAHSIWQRKAFLLSIQDLTGPLWALASVMVIDLVLAGDNAIVVGLAAAGLPAHQRRLVIIWGVGAATVLRIAFASVVLKLLAIIGLTLAGGILLLWVAWKVYRELRVTEPGPGQASLGTKTAQQAFLQIVLADISMSLDNVLAVAGAARNNFLILVGGLTLSVALMGVASNLVARLLERHRWLSWLGLLLVTSVALRMIYEGSLEVAERSVSP